MDILHLPQLVESLPEDQRKIFDRIFDISVNKGELVLPDTMEEWAENKLGNCEEQHIVRVTNKVMWEGTLFNELRSKRPVDVRSDEELDKIIEETRGGLFCHPETQTPADPFGRVKGKHCITAANIAKYDYLHGLIIFNDHNPFICDQKKIEDYLQTAAEWLNKANEYDSRAIYPFFMWNCLWRAAASIVHGHAQVLLSDKPYSTSEFIKNTTSTYSREYDSEYFSDLFTVHKALGLGKEVNRVKVVANLTPIKEKEIIMISQELANLPFCISRALKCYYRLGVRSFTLAIFMPPMEELAEEEFPYVVRLVDRGDPMSRTTDIGAMELYAGHSVVSDDPFKVFKELEKELK
ncbi:MAG: hypothetical protein R6U44_12360 [Archaeoglobaceae archaeon]